MQLKIQSIKIQTKFIILLLLQSLFLSSCALNPFASKDNYNNYSSTGPRAKPYTIRGETYYPLLSAHGFEEEGIASWYGPNFHGKKTANGEKYNQYEMTAAHKILPFNTKVKVTNLRNGKSTIVRINDRGPFVSGRVIDLSNKAAKAIDMLGSGTAPVRLESIGGIANQQYDGDIKGKFYIQVGAFSISANAKKLSDAFRKAGWKTRILNQGLSTVQIGPFNSLKKAYEAVPILLPSYPDLIVISDK